MVAKDYKGAPRGTLGTHVVAEFVGCSSVLLENEAFLKKHAQEACRLAGATVLGTHAHKFEPQGVTVLVLLAESHLTVHTWPEYGYAAVDVFTCGEGLKPQEAVLYLAAKLTPRNYWVLKIARGCHRKLGEKISFESPLLRASAPTEVVCRVEGAKEVKKTEPYELASPLAREESTDPLS